MGKFVVRATIACFVTIVAACGGRYGADDNDDNQDVDASLVDAASDVAKQPTAFDASDDAPVDTGSDVDGGPSVISTSAACIRASSSLPRLPAAHIVTVYEGVKGDAGVYVVNVKVAQADTVLVLSSFTPEQWRITYENGGSLSHVHVRVANGNLAAYELVGVPSNVPVTVKGNQLYSRGWTRDANSGGGQFGQQIQAIRADIGGLETTFQGTYTGTSFTVGGALPSGATGIESYDTRAACADPCSRTGTITKWENAAGRNATISSLSATGENNGADLRTDDGPRCGKHYFEVQTTTAATVGLTALDDQEWISFGVPNTLNVAANTRVGVAVDFEANTITYTTKTGAAAAVTQPTKQLGAWFREAIGPAYQAQAKGTVTLVTRAPFALPVPADYAPDL